jgi:hypothetical protein
MPLRSVQFVALLSFAISICKSVPCSAPFSDWLCEV